MDVGWEEPMHYGRKYEYFLPLWMKLDEEAAMAARKPWDELTVVAGSAGFLRCWENVKEAEEKIF